jgi:FkbM family methyltransferase
VFDCGACIGEISALFANFVGAHGEVHLFDPVPLHTRYCQLQATLNPVISHVFKINAQAVSNITQEAKGYKNDSNMISPGGLVIDSYSMISLDDYFFKNKISRINLIKILKARRWQRLKAHLKLSRGSNRGWQYQHITSQKISGKFPLKLKNLTMIIKFILTIIVQCSGNLFTMLYNYIRVFRSLSLFCLILILHHR